MARATTNAQIQSEDRGMVGWTTREGEGGRRKTERLRKRVNSHSLTFYKSDNL